MIASRFRNLVVTMALCLAFGLGGLGSAKESAKILIEGVHPGQAIADVESVLGTPAVRAKEKNVISYRYKSGGELLISANSSNRVVTVMAWWQGATDRPRVTLNGRILITGSTTDSELIQALGNPSKRLSDKAMVVLDFTALGLQVTFKDHRALGATVALRR